MEKEIALNIVTNYKIMFVIVFFSGILFGVVAQKIAEGTPVKPFVRRIAIAGLTTSIALTLNDLAFKLSEPTLYTISPIIGFFGEVVVETLNTKRTGIGKGIIEILFEKIGFVKKEDKSGEKNG